MDADGFNENEIQESLEKSMATCQANVEKKNRGRKKKSEIEVLLILVYLNI